MSFFSVIPIKFGKQKLWRVGIVAVGVLGTVAVAQNFLHSNSLPEINLEEDTVLVRYYNLRIQVKANGVVQPIRKINISPREAGRIVELRVREGDRLQAGQIIARMDDQSLQAQASQYQAVLARSQSELAERLAGNRQEEIAKAAAEVVRYQAQLQEARSRLQLATSKLSRREFLANQGAISRESLDESRTEARNARDNLEQIQASLAIAQAEFARQQSGPRLEEIDRARAQVTESAAQLRFYQIQLENTLVRAPFAGVVTRRFTDAGDFVAPTTSASTSDGATSASIVELSSGLEVEAKLPEASIARIKPGQSVEIRSDSYPDQVFQGRVRLIAPRAVQENNITTFRVKVLLQTGGETLRSGMNVKLVFLGEPIKNALAVPLAAVITQRNGQKGVWVVNSQGEPRLQIVRLGAESGDQAQILEGLKVGDRILLNPPASQVIPGVDNTEGTGL
jgi:HlyD family secretion protein